MKKIFILVLLFINAYFFASTLETKNLGDNYFTFKKDNLIGAKSTNKVIIPPIYEEISYLGNNYFLIKKNNFYGLMYNDEILLRVKYQKIQKIEDTYYFLILKNNLFGIALDNQILIPPKFLEITYFKNDYFRIKDSKGYGLFIKGKKILEPVYKEISIMETTDYINVKVNKMYGLFFNLSQALKSKKEVILKKISNEYSEININGNRGILYDNKLVLRNIFEDIKYLGKDRFRLKYTKTNSETDNILFNIMFNSIEFLSDNYIKFQTDEGYGLIFDNKIIFNSIYKKLEIEDLNVGYYAVHTDQGTGIIKWDNVLLMPLYDEVKRINNYYYTFSLEGNKGLLISDKIVLYPHYKNIFFINNSLTSAFPDILINSIRVPNYWYIIIISYFFLIISIILNVFLRTNLIHMEKFRKKRFILYKFLIYLERYLIFISITFSCLLTWGFCLSYSFTINTIIHIIFSIIIFELTSYLISFGRKYHFSKKNNF